MQSNDEPGCNDCGGEKRTSEFPFGQEVSGVPSVYAKPWMPTTAAWERFKEYPVSRIDLPSVLSGLRAYEGAHDSELPSGQLSHIKSFRGSAIDHGEHPASIGNHFGRTETGVPSVLTVVDQVEHLPLTMMAPWGLADHGHGLMSVTGGWKFKTPPQDTVDKGTADDAAEYEGKDKWGRDVINGVRLLGVPKVGPDGRKNHFPGPPPAELPCRPKGTGECEPAEIGQFEFPQYDWFDVVRQADWGNAQQAVRWTGLVGTIQEIWIVESTEVSLDYRVCTYNAQKCCCGDDCFVYHWGWDCKDKEIKRTISREKKIERSDETFAKVLDLIGAFLKGLAEGGGKAAGEGIASATFEALGLK